MCHFFTNLPLAPDQPGRLGIKEYCEVCTKCASACPPKALPFDEPTDQPQNASTLGHVKKWSADCEKCFGYWAKLKTDCAICMRVCPFNRDFSQWRHRLWLRLALSPMRRLALWLDRKRGGRVKPASWWARGS